MNKLWLIGCFSVRFYLLEKMKTIGLIETYCWNGKDLYLGCLSYSYLTASKIKHITPRWWRKLWTKIYTESTVSWKLWKKWLLFSMIFLLLPYLPCFFDLKIERVVHTLIYIWTGNKIKSKAFGIYGPDWIIILIVNHSLMKEGKKTNTSFRKYTRIYQLHQPKKS